ncbi:MAG: sodium-dependent transporter [Oscillospiraceae bacterium]
MEKRGNFSNKLGFVLAAAGSAVGLGNIWRFPYLVANYGGGMFLLVYLLLVVSFGFTLMVTEIAIGRKTGLSPIGAFKKLNKKFAFVGVLSVFVPLLIASYYSVVGGWITKYFMVYITGAGAGAAADGFFSNYIGQAFQPLLWQALFIGASMIILLGGVKGGIEKAGRILMPLLVLISIIIAIYSICLPGAMEGVKYLFTPNIKDFTFETVIAAMGQMFYSMSLAMGIMITYGSYVKKEDDIAKSVAHIEMFDTFIAICAAIMIVPAVFAFSGGDKEALGQGAGLMFVTLPKVFNSMPFGGFMGGLFFLLVIFAALTSLISIMEVLVSTVCDRSKIKRKTATVAISIITFVIGIPSSLGYGVLSSFTILGMSILDFIDFLTNSIMLPVVALCTCILVGYVIGPKAISDEVKLSSEFKREKVFVVMIKYIAPIFLLVILASAILKTFVAPML